MVYIDTLWCCIGPNSQTGKTTADFRSLAVQRKQSIQKLLDAYPENYDWAWCKKQGWKCVKVEVAIEPMAYDLPIGPQ